MDEALLDTDILSEVLKRKDPQVLAMANKYLATHQRFAFSAMTMYEVILGRKPATTRYHKSTLSIKIKGTPRGVPSRACRSFRM